MHVDPRRRRTRAVPALRRATVVVGRGRFVHAFRRARLPQSDSPLNAERLLREELRRAVSFARKIGVRAGRSVVAVGAPVVGAGRRARRRLVRRRVGAGGRRLDAARGRARRQSRIPGRRRGARSRRRRLGDGRRAWRGHRRRGRRARRRPVRRRGVGGGAAMDVHAGAAQRQAHREPGAHPVPLSPRPRARRRADAGRSAPVAPTPSRGQPAAADRGACRRAAGAPELPRRCPARSAPTRPTSPGTSRRHRAAAPPTTTSTSARWRSCRAANAAEFLKLAPGILLTNEGGEGHAEQVFLRGFDAREGQDIEFTVDGIPINESGNLHGNGYSDLHFIIPELVQSLRVLEGPFDPRQGNYAVAGSADYHLGLAERGLTAKFSTGNYGTNRMLLLYGPQHMSDEHLRRRRALFRPPATVRTARASAARPWRNTKAAAAPRATGLFAQAYISSFHSAGVVRDDDYRSGRVCFYCTEDPLQGEDAQRYSVGVAVSHKGEHVRTENLVFGIVRPLRLRENFTGFLLDVQSPLQPSHGQRGDLVDLNIMEETVGLRGSARLSGVVLKQLQEIEIGYFARGDFGSGIQQRIEAATGHPYQTDVDNDFPARRHRPLRRRQPAAGALAGAARRRARRSLHVRRAEQLRRAGRSSIPNPTEPLYGQSCLSEENMGAYREPTQRASTASLAYMPRGSVLVGPFWGLSRTGVGGRGRALDRSHLHHAGRQDAVRAHHGSYEGGLSYAQPLPRGAIDLSLSSVVFNTNVDHDLIFQPTSGQRAARRSDHAHRLRLDACAPIGRFYDVGANLTWVRATYARHEPPRPLRARPGACAATARSSARCRGAGRAGTSTRCSRSLRARRHLRRPAPAALWRALADHLHRRRRRHACAGGSSRRASRRRTCSTRSIGSANTTTPPTSTRRRSRRWCRRAPSPPARR